MTTRRQRALALLALLLPLGALVEVVAGRAIHAGVPGAPSWDEVAEAVRKAHQPDDLVVIAPRWAEPHVRARLGDDVMPLAHLARPDVSRFAHATEVSLDGARAPELTGFRERGRTEVGPFVVRRLDNLAPEPVVYDFVERFGPETRVSGTSPAVACRWSSREQVLAGGLGGHPTFPASRFVCPGGPFMNASVTVIADEEFLPRRCIWAHPFAQGEKVIAFDDVPVGRATRLVGHHGLYWIIERDGGGADIELEARVDGASIGFAKHVDGDGWSRFGFDLPRMPPDARATVELRVRTKDNQHRHYCVEATLR